MEKEIKSPIQPQDIIEDKIKEAFPNAYVIRENIDKCVMCGKEEDLRMNWCWYCAEAQNIIATGRTMMDDEDGTEILLPIVEVNKRLKMLMEKGWRYVTPTPITNEDNLK